MACFLAPVAEAIVVSIVKHNLKKKEEITFALPKNESDIESEKEIPASSKTPFSHKLGWLQKLLWGGSFLLLFEHIWHGEIVFYFPFLTAMQNKADTLIMLKEIATVGVTMALLCTAVWGCMLAISKRTETKNAKAKTLEKKAGK